MSRKKGRAYGSTGSRPVGDAGRGKHTGKVGPLGGIHRANDGCLDVILLIVGSASSMIIGIGYVFYALYTL